MTEKSTGMPDGERARGAFRAHAETLLATAQQARAAYHQLRDQPGYNAAVALNLCWETQWTLRDYLEAHPSELADLEWVSNTSVTSINVVAAINLPNRPDEATVLSDEFAEAFMDVMRRSTTQLIVLPDDVTWEHGRPEIINRPYLSSQGAPDDRARQDSDLTVGRLDVAPTPEPPDSIGAAGL